MVKITLNQLVENAKYAAAKTMKNTSEYFMYLSCEKLGIPTGLEMQIEKQINVLKTKDATNAADPSGADKVFALRTALEARYPDVATRLMPMLHAYDKAVTLQADMSSKIESRIHQLCEKGQQAGKQRNYEQAEAEAQECINQVKGILGRECDVKGIVRTLKHNISKYLYDLRKQGPEYRCVMRAIMPFIPFDTAPYFSAYGYLRR